MNRLVTIISILIISSSCGYYYYNNYKLVSQKNEIKVIFKTLSNPSNNKDFYVYTKKLIKLNKDSYESGKSLFFADDFRKINVVAEDMFFDVPIYAIRFLKKERGKVWSYLKNETKIDDQLLRNKIDFLKILLGTVIRVKIDLDEFIKQKPSILFARVRRTSKIVDQAKLTDAMLGKMDGLEELIDQAKLTATFIKELTLVGRSVSISREEAYAVTMQGMEQIEKANVKLEKYAELKTLRECYDNWVSAYEIIKSAKTRVENPEELTEEYQVALASKILSKDIENLNNILEEIYVHLDKVVRVLAQAENQEKTLVGKVQRFAGRNIDRARKSRIGREITLMFKTMILGTKILYDMLEYSGGGDMVSWAHRYQSDMDQLSEEMEEILKLEDWSLTGKNTFLEDLANNAYEKSFR